MYATYTVVNAPMLTASAQHGLNQAVGQEGRRGGGVAQGPCLALFTRNYFSTNPMCFAIFFVDVMCAFLSDLFVDMYVGPHHVATAMPVPAHSSSCAHMLSFCPFLLLKGDVQYA